VTNTTNPHLNVRVMEQSQSGPKQTNDREEYDGKSRQKLAASKSPRAHASNENKISLVRRLGHGLEA
jgi:hypothetical protein